MTYSFLGPDPVESQVNDVLRLLSQGKSPREIERSQVEVKEEPGRRGRDGTVRLGLSANEGAAKYLAEEAACMANTPGGGAIILGIADDGRPIGTDLDPEWLRHRIWELADQKLTVDVRVASLGGVRLLVLSTHEAIEPIRFAGKVKWRVEDNCVEVDPTTWHTGKLTRSGVDWSAQQSGHTLADADPIAIGIARRYLEAAGDEPAMDLARASDEDLLRRLNVVDGNGRLTNAGSLLFVGTPAAGIDYIRRDVPGADSISRIRTSRPLLEQVWEVDHAASLSNRLIHTTAGFARGQVRALPPRALREAIVNGVVHRDWGSMLPTVVEHTGDVVTVTSPGGFIGGIDPTNIITHPAVSRYRSLAQAMAAMRLAEREGIGVDRMVRDMVALGRPLPEISEMAGPYVRVGLFGGEPDAEFVDLFASVTPATVAADVDAVMLIEKLTRQGWIDVERAAPVLQRPAGETAAAIARLEAAKVDGEDIIVPVSGVPDDQAAAWRLSTATQNRLAGRLRHLATPGARKRLILDWATSRRRVSTSEVADLTGLSIPHSGQVLGALEHDGLLEPGRANRRGRGFYYRPVGT